MTTTSQKYIYQLFFFICIFYIITNKQKTNKKQTNKQTMPNHGVLCKDLIGCSLQIYSKLVLDRACNLRVANIRATGTLKVDGAVTLQGDLTAGNITGDTIKGNAFCTDAWIIDQDGSDNLNFQYNGNTEAQIMPDGLLCGHALAVGLEIVTATLGAATLDADIGVSLVNGSTVEGTTVVALPDPSNTKTRMKNIIAADVDGGIMSLQPVSWGGVGTGLSFDADGQGATLVWAAGAWWCVGNCGAQVTIV